jgi:hypothetical protein
MAKTNAAESRALNFLLRGEGTPATSYTIALFTADPGETGVLTSEVSGGGYTRPAVTFTASTNGGASQNVAEVLFAVATASWGNVSHWGVIDNLSTMLYRAPITGGPLAVTENRQVRFAPGALVITED